MIGVFDSGVGGLSVLREIRSLIPRADVVYIADQARAPYGERSLDEVRHFADEIATRLISLGATTVVVACNTASAAALRQLREHHHGVHFVGMEPAVKPAAAATRSGVIGVLATPATFQARVVAALVDRFAADVRVIPRPCPGLADLVEDGGPSEATLRRHIDPLLEAGADTLVLGCTHYAFLAQAIAEMAGPGVTVIDPAPAVARQVARVAKDVDGRGSTVYLTTGDPKRFASQVLRLLGEEIKTGKIDL
jgi:glutamate racemase